MRHPVSSSLNESSRVNFPDLCILDQRVDVVSFRVFLLILLRLLHLSHEDVELRVGVPGLVCLLSLKVLEFLFSFLLFSLLLLLIDLSFGRFRIEAPGDRFRFGLLLRRLQGHIDILSSYVCVI